MVIQENISLQPFNTFGIPATARYLVRITSQAELEQVIQHPVYSNNRRFILGGGSNVLFTKDFDGLVMKVEIMGKSLVEETSESMLVTAGAGEAWHPFVMSCVEQSLGGIENLSLIPGTVGAAPIQNIGAYGVELKQVIAYVDGIDLDAGVSRRFTRDECQFEYRDSVFKHTLKEKFLISSITLRLMKKNHPMVTHYGAIKEVLNEKKIDHPTIRDVSNAVIAIRRSKLPDPTLLGNAGSFFKNPVVDVNLARSIQDKYPSAPVYPIDNQFVKMAAGWLIEQCGWKGKKIGRVGVHDQQALVLVNFGGANGEEIHQLATEIQQSVLQKFGITLMMEVNIL